MLSNSVQLSSKLSNTAHDITKLNKRLSSLEQEYQSLSSNLLNEINSRTNLENYSKTSNEALSSKITVIKDGMNSLTKLVSESINDFKQNMNKEMLTNSQTLKDTIDSKLKKIDFYDKQSIDSNHHFDSLQQETNKKLSLFEKKVDGQLKSFREDLNTNLVHVEFLEKRFNDNYNILKSDIATISKELVVIRNEIIALKQFKNSSIETTQSMSNSILRQEEFTVDFTNRINIIANELQDKMTSFENLFNNQSNSYSKVKEEIEKHLNTFDETSNQKIKEMDNGLNSHKGEVCKEIESFEQHIISEQEKFNIYIQNSFEEHTINIQKLTEYLSIDISGLKDNQQSIDRKLQTTKSDVFNNLNEVEEFLTKKYESLFNIINNDLTLREYHKMK